MAFGIQFFADDGSTSFSTDFDSYFLVGIESNTTIGADWSASWPEYRFDAIQAADVVVQTATEGESSYTVRIVSNGDGTYHIEADFTTNRVYDSEGNPYGGLATFTVLSRVAPLSQFSTGFQVRDVNGYLTHNDNADKLKYWGKAVQVAHYTTIAGGLCPGGTENRYLFKVTTPQTVRPLCFVHCADYHYESLRWDSANNWWEVEVVVVVGGASAPTVYAFTEHSDVIPGVGWGMQVYDDGGNVIFDGDYRPTNIIGTPSFAIGGYASTPGTHPSNTVKPAVFLNRASTYRGYSIDSGSTYCPVWLAVEKNIMVRSVGSDLQFGYATAYTTGDPVDSSSGVVNTPAFSLPYINGAFYD